jgi:hypothetical protein
MKENNLKNLDFEQVRSLDEVSWRLWTYLQFRDINKKLGWVIKILVALVGAVFGVKLI